ncbi:UDP-N-acetyl-D-mannosaminuronic acid dehydrogenase [Candidatus Nitrosotalea sp. FS]|uniref:nucleotide sugar dehydrogenase n=1 Tax=Candidatus Nitrosotalea sp. FS TaxID=2341021 RepID=UPI00140D2F4C|nr:nucleotide sugar dehydrogenase [Candidatus Nitrosotalea sp. FS]NHH97502.1 UDP-N-acetyl-D-mannosaminuronic acid dehydrogenase [Candidatus Nitrosotalea sp. FS]
MKSMPSNLLSKIEKHEAKICVIGLGQVGLPTALTFCQSGFDITGHDINKDLLAALNQSKAPFEEKGLDELLKSCVASKRFHTDPNIEDSVRNADVIIVCVATPLTSGIMPDLSYLEKACQSISEMSLENKLVIIESSISPGTFKGLILPMLEKRFKLGTHFWAAFVPERLAPGTALSEIKTTPRVIGYVDEESSHLAASLYGKMVNSQIVSTSVEVAEISKLVENAFRDVNVAFANEVGLICENYGIDVAELIKVCNSHPRVKLLQPGPGVGGPCLPKDPYLLLNPPGKKKIESAIILDSRKINDNMPFHVVNLVIDALMEQGKKISESTVLVLGVSYKANVSDTRFSPSKDIVTQLGKNGCNVIVHDPKSKETFGGQRTENMWESLSQSDALVLVTDHDEFKNLDLAKIKQTIRTPIIIDTRRIFSRNQAEGLGIKYISVGYTKTLKDK